MFEKSHCRVGANIADYIRNKNIPEAKRAEGNAIRMQRVIASGIAIKAITLRPANSINNNKADERTCQ